MNTNIAPLSRETLEHLLPMWRAYQEFYGVTDIDEAQNSAHVAHILQHTEEGLILLATRDERPAGFATLYYTYTSTRACKVAVLNDLYVDPGSRRSGVGQRLIEAGVAAARALGLRHMRWTTAESNVEAQHLYARYGEPTLWKMYSLDVERVTARETARPRPPQT